MPQPLWGTRNALSYAPSGGAVSVSAAGPPRRRASDEISSALGDHGHGCHTIGVFGAFSRVSTFPARFMLRIPSRGRGTSGTWPSRDSASR